MLATDKTKEEEKVNNRPKSAYLYINLIIPFMALRGSHFTVNWQLKTFSDMDYLTLLASICLFMSFL